MATTLRRPNSRLTFADEVSYRDSPVVADLDNSFPENFIIGDRVWLNGIYPARIQYIGEVHFGHGDDWAGLVMDEPIGRHDGSIGGHRYYYCENKKGLFTRLSKLTRVPLRAQESPDSGITTSPFPTRPPRQRHYSSPSPILKNSSIPNSKIQNTSNTIRQSPVFFNRNYSNSPKELDRSYEYYYEYNNRNKDQRNLNRSTGSSENLNQTPSSPRSSPYSRQSSLTSPSLLNYHFSRSSTPKFQPSVRSLSSGSRQQPRIHHIKIELEKEALDFKKNLKKACSEDLKDSANDDLGEKSSLKLGDYVYVDSSKGLLSGKLRYLGSTEFKEGHWAGVELELPYGRHDGKVDGKRYFTCKRNHGLFAPCHRVFKQRIANDNKPFKSTRFADDL